MAYNLLKTLLESDQNEEQKGTFVGVKLSNDSEKRVKLLIEEGNIPNPIDIKDLHITVAYSRKYLPDFEARGKLEEPITAKVTGLDIFPSQDTDKKALVLRLKSPKLTYRHNQIRKKHGATFDFSEYKPHLTLSYDAGDYDISDVEPTEFVKELEIDTEYMEDLNLDWNNSKDEK